MDATPTPLFDSNPHQPLTAVVVSPRAWETDYLDAVVRSLGFRALTAGDFHTARQLLAYRPHLLISELRLVEYNGLQLVMHAIVVRPRMTAIVTSRRSDAVLQRDAEMMGATFVQTPTGREELIAAILRTATNAGPAPVESIRPPFERRGSQRRAGAGRPLEERRVAERRRDVTSVLEEAAGLWQR